MNCDDLRRALDEDVVSPAAASEHLAACAACRQAYEGWLAAQQGLRAMARDEAPAFLHARLMVGVREVQRRAKRRAPAFWLAPLVAAAFVAVTGLWVWRQSPKSEPRPAAGGEPAARAKPAGDAEPKASDLRALGYLDATTEGRRHQATRAPTPQERQLGKSEQESKQGPARPAARAPAPACQLAPEEARGLEEDSAAHEKVEAAAPDFALADRGGGSGRTAGLAAEDAAPAQRDELAIAPAGPTVRCSLVALDGDGASRVVALPVRLAPAVGVAWEITVSPTGQARVVSDDGGALREELAKKGDDRRGRVQKAKAPAALLPILNAEALAAGRYLLRRAD